jgi:hypothetical protein
MAHLKQELFLSPIWCYSAFESGDMRISVQNFWWQMDWAGWENFMAIQLLWMFSFEVT